MNKEFKKVPVKLIGENGNVFNLLGICTKALKNHGYYDEAKQLTSRVLSCKSYEEALNIMTEYVDYCENKDIECEDIDLNFKE